MGLEPEGLSSPHPSTQSPQKVFTSRNQAERYSEQSQRLLFDFGRRATALSIFSVAMTAAAS
jgi:hypothetical protein